MIMIMKCILNKSERVRRTKKKKKRQEKKKEFVSKSNENPVNLEFEKENCNTWVTGFQYFMKNSLN